MTEDARKERNRQMLLGANPAFRTQLVGTLLEMQDSGYRPRLQCVWRSVEDEAAAHLGGHSDVTFGFHNTTTPDGKPDALAADVLDDNAPLSPSRDYVMTLVRAARAHGLDTGILWHLPENVRHALDYTIRSGGEWTGHGVGFDPCHVQCTGITIEQARDGERPPPFAVPVTTAVS